MKVMFVVTSLMGAGHLQRTLILARALRDAGGTPIVVSGGRPLDHLNADGVTMETLPSISADGYNYRDRKSVV